MMRWCRPFDYTDGLDVVEPSGDFPTKATEERWKKMRRDMDRLRDWHAQNERRFFREIAYQKGVRAHGG